MSEDEAHDALVVTGMGIVSPIGVGQDAFFAALSAGEHGIHRVDRFSTSGYRCHLAATLPEAWMEKHAPSSGALDPAAAMAIVAAREAWTDARLEDAGVPRERVALVLGTSAGGFGSRSRYELAKGLDDDERHALFTRSQHHVQTAAVADALGVKGPRVTVSTACTSSTHALWSARTLLLAGDADVALAGGVDVLVEAIFAGFHAMGAMSPEPCAPFSTPEGMTAGEGAGFFVLERAKDARRRAAPIRCFVNGFAASSDAHHATAPDPTGRGLARALGGALVDAGISPADVDAVSAHGTGTDANDAAEWAAIEQVLEARAPSVPVSATKSFFGHALGAAGVLELAATILGLERGVVAPTLHHRGPRLSRPMDAVESGRARPCVQRHVLKSASGFAGINAAVVVSSTPAPPRSARRDDVVVLGASAYVGRPDALDALDAEAAAFTDVRALDSLGRHLTVLGRRALADANVQVRSAQKDRAGVVLGAPTMSWDTVEEFWNTVRARGFPRASVPAFSRTVMNAPAGAVARALGLRGHASVLASGPLSGALAAIEGARTLSTRRDLDLLLVGSAFEMGASLRWDHARRHPSGRPAAGEGGACLVLARREWAAGCRATPRARIAATAARGPGQAGDAIACVLAAARTSPDAVVVAFDGTDGGRARVDVALASNGLSGVPVIDPGALSGYGEAGDARALHAAVEHLCDPRTLSVLVVAEAEDVGSAVLAVTRDRD